MVVIIDAVGMTNGEDDAQRRLTDWQQRLSEIERATRGRGAEGKVQLIGTAICLLFAAV